MPVVFHQECHHSVALRSAAQPAAVEGPFNRLGVHEHFRLCLRLDFVKAYALVAAASRKLVDAVLSNQTASIPSLETSSRACSRLYSRSIPNVSAFWTLSRSAWTAGRGTSKPFVSKSTPRS